MVLFKDRAVGVAVQGLAVRFGRRCLACGKLVVKFPSMLLDLASEGRELRFLHRLLWWRSRTSRIRR